MRADDFENEKVDDTGTIHRVHTVQRTECIHVYTSHIQCTKSSDLSELSVGDFQWASFGRHPGDGSVIQSVSSVQTLRQTVLYAVAYRACRIYVTSNSRRRTRVPVARDRHRTVVDRVVPALFQI